MKPLLTILLLFLIVPSAVAQKPEHPPWGMGYFDVGTGTHGMGLNASLGGEVNIAKGFGVGAEVGAIGVTAPDNNNDKETGLCSLDLIYHHFPKKLRRNAAPFLAGGYSEFFGHNTHTKYGGGGSYSTHGFNLGAGLDVFVPHHLGVRFDLRYYGHGGRILNYVYPDVQQFSFVAFRVGLTFR